MTDLELNDVNDCSVLFCQGFCPEGTQAPCERLRGQSQGRRPCVGRLGQCHQSLEQ